MVDVNDSFQRGFIDQVACWLEKETKNSEAWETPLMMAYP